MKINFGSLCDPTRIILDMHHVPTISVAQHWMQSLRSIHSLRAHSNHIRIIILRSEFKNSINHTSLNRATNHDVSLDLSFATYLHIILIRSKQISWISHSKSFFLSTPVIATSMFSCLAFELICVLGRILV